MSQFPRATGRTPASSGTATPTPATTAASQGSQTLLQTTNPPPTLPSATLRLRAEPATDEQTGTRGESSRRIRWSEDVVDNEGMGKKSSKVCCIYHAPREPGDSESESSSSSSSDAGSDSEPDLSRAQPASRGGRRGAARSNGKGKGNDSERKPSPNAYERQPKVKNRQGG